MMDAIRRGWMALRRTADWRAFMGGDPPWLTNDVVVFGASSAEGGTRPRVQSYEVYVHGRLIAQRPSLVGAKSAAEDEVGQVLDWKQGKTEPVEVEHYYFGPTREFSSPNTYWYVEKL